MLIVQAIRTLSPTGWRCSACRYDISGLPEGELEGGARAIRCPECGSLCMTAYEQRDLKPARLGSTPIAYNPDRHVRAACAGCGYTESGTGPRRPFCPNCGVSHAVLERRQKRRLVRGADRRLLLRLFWPFASFPALLPLYFLLGRLSVVIAAAALALLGTANVSYWFVRAGSDNSAQQDLALLGDRPLLQSKLELAPHHHPLFVMLVLYWLVSLMTYLLATFAL